MTKRATLAERSGELIGRGRDLDVVRALIENGASLVTLTGPAGVGKSALARRVADLVDAIWCDVTEAADSASLERAVAKSLAVPMPRGAGSSDALRAALRRSACVLVLDNCEHLAESGAQLVERWLAEAPELQLLLTTRVTFRLPDERVHELRPLRLPESAADAQGSEAGLLWLERVRARTSDYEIGGDAPLVARLLRELDGLPLAIELAAARHSVLGPGTLLARIDDRLDLLGPRGAGTRGTALRAAIDVSWSLLDPVLERALARCALFCDGFSLEAAEAVIEDSSGSDVRAVDVLQELRDHSLLQGYADPAFPGEQRFRMLLSIRSYALQALTRIGDKPAAERRVQAYFTELAERLARDVQGRSPARAYRQLAVERANLVAVAQRCLEGSTDADAVAAMRILVALEAQLRLEGPFLGAVETFLAMLQRQASIGGSLRARALSVLAHTLIHAGEREQAHLVLTQAIELAAAEGARSVEVEAEVARADLSMQAGRMVEAEASMRRALMLAGEVEDRPRARAEIGALKLYLTARLGDLGEVRVLAENAVARLRRAGALVELRIALRDLAALHCERHQFDAARRVLRASEEAIDWPGCLGAYVRMSDVYARGRTELIAGDLAAAEQIFARALDVERAPGDIWIQTASRALRAIGRWQRGRGAEAKHELELVVADFAAKGLEVTAATAAAILAAVEADLNELEQARARLDRVVRLDSGTVPLLSATVELARAFLDLAESRSAKDPSIAAERRAAAVARLEQLERLGDPSAGGFSDAHLLCRGLRAAIAESPTPPSAPASVLRVARDGSWFEAGGLPRVQCARRPVMRRIVQALAEAHRDDPGRPVPARSLVALGWPGEKIMPTAAKSRLQMMISRLRELGLRELLSSQGDGYLLDPASDVCFSE